MFAKFFELFMAAENLKDIRKLVKEFLWKSLNTDQMNYVAKEADPRFDLGKVSGFGHSIVVTRQTAADVIVDYFATEDAFLHLFATLLFMEGKNASGGVIHFVNPDPIIKKLRERQWIYDPSAGRFIKSQSQTRTADWGFLQEGSEYSLVFGSIDIVGSSALARTNVPVDVENTLVRMRAYLQDQIEARNGRIWYWHGDGGVMAFYGADAASRAVISSVAILAYLPIFNLTQNELRPENDVSLRIGLHAGLAVYRSDTEKILSPDIRFAEEVEKHCAETNTIAITERTVNSLPPEVRRQFNPAGEHSANRIYVYRPV
ncbi:MAG TPA: adenylate/guanylate cyclase domain-containing protein [Leptospiraceae bacterium]|nr:hypothetical protein [Leptospirales bacterium]HMU85139.1 adenylate/guanylate cyclase domain-containing protein [Leptospiraceae bacterium]HMW61008.1 adenylate/guanylate cyclase domain-containing protein [Leptospiraceae bacterium]HMX56150.1 adenylate/guanylate cyclase domain-containing protein [Leptospiraceae bacterium]HNE23469.1 adenylate/guanylate cyclase domain-containing protein [Leptospiraceae bacterium]